MQFWPSQCSRTHTVAGAAVSKWSLAGWSRLPSVPHQPKGGIQVSAWGVPVLSVCSELSSNSCTSSSNIRLDPNSSISRGLNRNSSISQCSSKCFSRADSGDIVSASAVCSLAPASTSAPGAWIAASGWPAAAQLVGPAEIGVLL